MTSSRLHGANTANASRRTGWISSRRSFLQVALLLLSTGVLIAAATVAAAEMPGSYTAYGPPSPPDSLHAAHALAPAPTSSIVASPLMVASSWSMSPLPEGEGGAVASSTAMSPIAPTSSVVASPQ